MALQSNGKIVAAGFTGVQGQFDFALARYNAGGALDTTFSGGGKLTTDFGTDIDRAFGLAIQSTDGKIVAAGCVNRSLSSSDFAVVRYLVA
ncbi:MAG: delta-60 repeat domain-containing protein [Actinomycetota bacterium]